MATTIEHHKRVSIFSSLQGHLLTVNALIWKFPKFLKNKTVKLRIINVRPIGMKMSTLANQIDVELNGHLKISVLLGFHISF